MAKTGRLIIAVGVLWVLAAACAPAAAPPTPTPLKPAAKPTAAPTPQVAATPKPAAPVAKKQLMFGTPPTTSSYYILAAAVGKVINKEVPEVAVTLVQTGGAAEENMMRIQRGEQDFTLAGLDGAYRAHKGIGRNWEKQPFADLRLFWGPTVGAVAFIVREDSGVKSLQDLEGKDFNPGGRGTTTEVLAKDVLQAVGIPPKYYVGGAGGRRASR